MNIFILSFNPNPAGTETNYNLCHQYRVRHLCSLTRLYYLLISFTFSSWYPLKMIMDSSKNGRWIILFKNFSRIRVENLNCRKWLRNVGSLHHQVQSFCLAIIGVLSNVHRLYSNNHVRNISYVIELDVELTVQETSYS